MTLGRYKHVDSTAVYGSLSTADSQMQLLKNNLEKITAERQSEKTIDTFYEYDESFSKTINETIFVEPFLKTMNDTISDVILMPERYTRIPFAGPVPISAFNQVVDTFDIPKKYYDQINQKNQKKAEKLRPMTFSLNSPNHPLSPFRSSLSPSRSPLSPVTPSKSLSPLKIPLRSSQCEIDENNRFLITSCFGGVDSTKSPTTPSKKDLKRDLNANKNAPSPLFHPRTPFSSPIAPTPDNPSILRQSSYAYDAKKPRRRRFKMPKFCQNESSCDIRYDQVNKMQ